MRQLVIDFNVDVGPYAFRELPATGVKDVAGLLSRFGITQAVVAATPAITYCSPHPANELLAADLAQAAVDGIVPYAVLNPVYPGWEADLDRCVGLGFRGLKLYPNYHAYDVAGEQAVALVRAAASQGLPAIVCLRVEDERHHHPLMKVPPVPADAVAVLARRVPEAVLILCGGAAGETVAFLEATDRPETLAEISYLKSPLNAIEEMVETVGSERLLFGSHLPFVYPQVALAKVREAYISDEDKAKILWGNAQRVLGAPAGRSAS